jgi:YVTN family beta-propeller protein
MAGIMFNKLPSVARLGVLLLAALPLVASRLEAQSGQALLVLSKGDLALHVVDPVTLRVLRSAPSGVDPHEVIASADGRFAYIANTQANAPAGTAHFLTAVNLSTMETSKIALDGLVAPHGVWFAGGKLYVTVEGSKAVARYDPQSQKIDWVMGTGQDRTHMVLVSKDQKSIYTTNINSATVSVIEERAAAGRGRGGAPARTDWAVTHVPVGPGAEGFDISPDGRQIWTANARASSVTIIDVATKTVAATLPVQFRAANRLKFTPDGKLVFISDLQGTDLVVLDVASRKEVKRIPLGGGAAGLQVDPKGMRVFVATGSQNAVQVVDIAKLEVIGKIDAGRNPDGMAWLGAP